MKSYVANIEEIALRNDNFRKVLYTAKNCQLVVMSIAPSEDIGEETHDLDQFIRCEKGSGVAILNDIEHNIEDGFAVIIPAGTKHNIKNTSFEVPLKLYTLYAPPNHKDAIIHKTKQEAESDEEHFDGKTSE